MQSVNLGQMVRLVGVSLVFPVLSSCGGGGDGSDSGGYSAGGGGSYGTANNAPRWSADSEAVEVAENSTEITLPATASDADGDTLSYSISGDDAGSFSVASSGALSFITAPDFESPQDADTNNVYELSLDVSDGSATASLSVTVTVTDVDEGSGASGGPVTGVVVAGSYLSEALVFQDLNEDGVKDEGESGATTDAQGAFSFEVDDYAAGKIISVGGVEPESGTAFGASFRLSGGTASEEALVISPLGSLLEAARASNEERVVQILQSLQVSESAAIRDPLEAIIAGDEGSVALALNHVQLSIITASLSAITGLSTLEIESAVVERAATTDTLLRFSSIQLLADVAADINDASLNAFITDVTGSLGRFLQQIVAEDTSTLAQFTDVGLRVVVSDSVAIASGDTALADTYRGAILGRLENNSALTNLTSQLPDFNEFSYRIDEGAAGGFQYTIDGADATASDIIVYARVGDTIRFDNVVSLTSHPFRLGSSPESSPLSEAQGVVIENNHHVALIVNENTPVTIYPYCQVHSNMFDRGRIEIVESFEGLQFPGFGASPLQVRGVVSTGKYDGAAGYTYDVYLSQDSAEAASDSNVHQHRMQDMPEVPFFMPDGQGYHGAVESSGRTEFKPISVQD